jgi:hypothetical protein
MDLLLGRLMSLLASPCSRLSWRRMRAFSRARSLLACRFSSLPRCDALGVASEGVATPSASATLQLDVSAFTNGCYSHTYAAVIQYSAIKRCLLTVGTPHIPTPPNEENKTTPKTQPWTKAATKVETSAIVGDHT